MYKNTWKAIFLNGEWRPVKSCDLCGAFERFRDVDSVIKYYCWNMKQLKKCDCEDPSIRIEYNKISPGCPLPNWKDVREHSPDEVPKDKSVILVKTKASGYGKIIERTCTYNAANQFPWNIHGVAECGNMWVISWRYIL
jgi:hypothetical protein